MRTDHDHTQTLYPDHLGGRIRHGVRRAPSRRRARCACRRGPATLGGLPANLIYSAAAPGVWQTKVESHAPQVSVADGKLTIKTKHPMNEEHYIVRHTLVSADGQVLGATTFYPSDKPESAYVLPAGYAGKLYATSFCNKHDFWVAELTV